MILPKMSRYVRTFKEKSRILMSLRIDGEKLLKKYKNICTKIEDLKNTGLDALLISDNIYTKTKVRMW